jgi:hypothetical protein
MLIAIANNYTDGFTYVAISKPGCPSTPQNVAADRKRISSRFEICGMQDDQWVPMAFFLFTEDDFLRLQLVCFRIRNYYLAIMESFRG